MRQAKSRAPEGLLVVQAHHRQHASATQAHQDKAKQNKSRQDKTKQNKAQSKAKESKPKQNKKVQNWTHAGREKQIRLDPSVPETKEDMHATAVEKRRYADTAVSTGRTAACLSLRCVLLMSGGIRRQEQAALLEETIFLLVRA